MLHFDTFLAPVSKFLPIYVFISIDLGGIFYNIFSIITSQMFPKMKKNGENCYFSLVTMVYDAIPTKFVLFLTGKPSPWGAVYMYHS